MNEPSVLAIILAGGKGSRLGALTDTRVKPALPMGGSYRLIDVSLSNLVHSRIRDIWLIEQYLPHSLNEHLSHGRPWDLDRNYGGLILSPPFEGGHGEGFATGNSDALYRHRERLAEASTDLVLVLSADQLYTLDFRDVIATHLAADAELTMVTTRIADDCSRYGVVTADEDGRVTAFDYKPEEPAGNLITAEIFCYSRTALIGALDELHAAHGELGDCGEDLVPHFVSRGSAVEHRMSGYWMDMGTLQSYWTAHLQLIDGDGAILDAPQWSIYTAAPQFMPARVDGDVTASLIAAGACVSGTVEHSVIGPGASIEAGAIVRDSVVLNGATIGAGVELTNCIVDLDAHVTGGGPRGSEGVVTLIGADGLIAERQPFDTGAALPRGFGVA